MPKFEWKTVVILILQALLAALTGSLSGSYFGQSAAVNCCAKVAPK